MSKDFIYSDVGSGIAAPSPSASFLTISLAFSGSTLKSVLAVKVVEQLILAI